MNIGINICSVVQAISYVCNRKICSAQLIHRVHQWFQLKFCIKIFYRDIRKRWQNIVLILHFWMKYFAAILKIRYKKNNKAWKLKGLYFVTLHFAHILSEKIYSCKANLGIFWVRILNAGSTFFHKANVTSNSMLLSKKIKWRLR